MMSPRSFLVTRQNHVHAQASQTQPNRRDSSPTLLSVSTTSDTTTKTKDETLLGIATDTPSASHTANSMPSIKRKDAERLSPSPSPPRTTSSITHIAGTTSPVQIPVKKSDASRPPQKLQRHHGERRSHHHGLTRPREAHNPEAVPPAVAALLAITNIPPQRSTRGSLRRGSRGDERRMTVNAIIERQQEVEKELSWNLSKSPMDLLLTPPEELDEDAFSMDDSVMGSLLSTRTISVESMPSLLDSSISGTISSTDSLQTPARGRRIQPTRRCLTPVSPPAGDILLDHPLSDSSVDVNELDFRVFEQSPSPSEKKHASKYALNPLKSAFKSNLTASLRALRNAARSFSNLNLTSIPPEDFLTRSILTLDPRIPYTDERRPPPLEDEPSEALRRYLNPTTARLEPLPASTPSPTTKVFTASIQMQTYRVQRARSAPPTSRTPVSAQADSSSSHTNPVAPNMSMPGPRQRELRENSDFIRIAVMEMAMRKKGKLDDRKPGRARLALPPRKTSGRPYEVGTDGVPVRWRSMSYP